MKNFLSYLPGILLALLIAFFAQSIESVVSISFIGDSVIALFIGILLNPLLKSKQTFEKGLNFTTKRVLKFSIVLLGASLSIGTILNVGSMSISIMFFTLLTSFGGGYFIGKWLGLDWKLSSLINAGTGICGGSAIAAVSPVINAKNKDIAYAISVTFIFDMVMIIVFPLMGRFMGLSDMAYGLWTGTAVNDTSSVVAAGYAFSEAAGDFATMVKLTRTLSIIPIAIIFSLIQVHLTKKITATTGGHSTDVMGSLKNVFPWFILGFLAMALLNSVGFIPVTVSALFKDASKFLMIMALGAIGLKTDLNEMKQSGIAPMVHGFLISLLVVIVSLVVQSFLGIV